MDLLQDYGHVAFHEPAGDWDETQVTLSSFFT